MDFGTLLHVAKKNNEVNKSEGKYYSTKYAPPKKESKESKKLSDNIQRFLQKRELEEKERQRKDKEKLNTLLAMRDEKSKNKIRKMLKVTKSANKSVLEDAKDVDHTAITMQGPEQPDQDDYGYVSNAANDFYKKYMEKVKDVKDDKGFAPSRPQSLKDLSGTKERVKAAITKETEDKKGHTRQRSTSSSTTTTVSNGTNSGNSSSSVARAYTTSKPLYDPEVERKEEERKKREEEQKRAKNRKPPPPPMDFHALLKLAEKKQHEPIEIAVPDIKTKKEPERLMTLKEKREQEERQKAKEARAERDKAREKDKGRMAEPATNGKQRKEVCRAETGSQLVKPNQGAMKSNLTTSAATSLSSKSSLPTKNLPQLSSGNNIAKKSNVPQKISSSGNAVKAPVAASSSSSSSSATNKPSSNALNSNKIATSNSGATASKNPYNGAATRDIKSIKTRQFPPVDVQKSRQFPPSDVRRPPYGGSRMGDNRKTTAASKRRILDDDEDEYDSEMDDFIDDGEDNEDYSSHIKAIFGYDKSRYRDVDEDDPTMESNFAQVQREEFISKKIGLQEDLEDMKQEAIEKKKKMLLKKRRVH